MNATTPSTEYSGSVAATAGGLCYLQLLIPEFAEAVTLPKYDSLERKSEKTSES